jgi:hypothetical protein
MFYSKNRNNQQKDQRSCKEKPLPVVGAENQKKSVYSISHAGWHFQLSVNLNMVVD